jgi:hypothetical protein
MEYKVNVFMLNPHFSQEHADAQHSGDETENNKKLDWEDEMRLNNINGEPQVKRKDIYRLCGQIGEKSFDYAIDNMMVISFPSDSDQEVVLACSEELYECHEIKEEQVLLTLKGEPYANPVPGVYIASNDFPIQLIQID